MTEQDTRQRAEAFFAAFAQGDIPFILDALTEDVRWVAHLDPVVPWAGDFSGRASVPAFFEALGDAVEVGAHPVHEIVAQGDTVVAMGDVTFRARATGREATSAWVYVWRFRDGKVCRYDQFNDPALAGAFR